MKKCKIICALCLCAVVFGGCILSFAADAGGQEAPNWLTATLLVNGVETSFVRNEYYQAYANDFGAYYYDAYQSEPPAEKIDADFYESIQSDPSQRYMTVIMTRQAADAAAAAAALALPEEDILAFCDQVPVVMIYLADGDIDALLASEAVAAVELSFPAVTSQTDVVTDDILDITYAPTTADARKILRYAVDLEEPPEDIGLGKRFFVLSDTDLDGRLTTDDARTALRIAVGLEQGNTYYRSDGASMFWSDGYGFKTPDWLLQQMAG